MKIRVLSKALQEKAEEELNENPKQTDSTLCQLKAWLEKQEHLKYKNDDQWLLNVLRGSKFSIERAKKKLDTFYTLKTVAPELSRNLDPFTKATQAHLKLTASVPLPTPENDPAAPRTFICSLCDYDPDEVTFTTMMHGEYMAIVISMNNDDNYAISGVKIVWDLKGLKLKSALQATPSLIKKLVLCYEKAYPTRLKGIYVINVPKFFEAVLNAIKLLMSKKLAARLYFYSTNDLEAVFQHVPQSIFPKEYGGNAGYLEDLRGEWKRTVENHHKMLLEEDNYYSDESKRPENYGETESIFGIEGSFRNLDID